MKFSSNTLCALTCTLLPGAAIAGNELLPPPETAALTPPAEEAAPATLLYLPDGGAVTATLGGRFLYDVSFNSADDDLKNIMPSDMYFDNAEFRSSRILIKGSIYENIKYKVNYDFAGGSVGFKDAWMETPVGCADLRVGRFYIPFGLENNTSSKYTTFLEKSPASALNASRAGGVLYHKEVTGDVNYTWGVSVTKATDGAGDYSGKDSGAYDVHARGTWAPTHDAETGDLVHLGVSYGMLSDWGGDLRFRARPANHAVPRIVDTGNFASDGYSIANAEFAYGRGPLSFQGEYYMAKTDEPDGGGMNPTFTGYYGQAGYFFTGEHRPYKKGTFGAVKPNKNYGEEGWGALQGAVRYSFLDLSDGGVYGGELTDITVGLNWFLNPNTRVMFNYIMSDVSDRDAPGGDGKLDAGVIRFQFHF